MWTTAIYLFLGEQDRLLIHVEPPPVQFKEIILYGCIQQK